MIDIRVEEIPIPSSAEGAATADFVRSIEIGNALETLAFGTTDMNYEPAEELPDYQDPFQPRRLVVARIGGEIVGRGTVQRGAAAGSPAWVSAGVLPSYRGRGIGSLLTERVEELAGEMGCRTAIAYAAVAEGSGERLPSPTGFGSVPALDPGVVFLGRRGYSLEQIERVSRLELPVPDLADRLVSAELASGPEYELRTWIGTTPPPWRTDLALLATRMSTDAPSAGLEDPEDVWTVERLVAEEERRETGNPRRLLVAAAEHVPTGRVVAYSELSIPRQAARAVQQYNTLVLREHRGHRLGMLVKLANLAQLERVSPGHPSVFTFNAEENRPMLRVNEEIGFVPVAVEGVWQKSL